MSLPAINGLGRPSARRVTGGSAACRACLRPGSSRAPAVGRSWVMTTSRSPPPNPSGPDRGRPSIPQRVRQACATGRLELGLGYDGGPTWSVERSGGCSARLVMPRLAARGGSALRSESSCPHLVPVGPATTGRGVRSIAPSSGATSRRPRLSRDRRAVVAIGQGTRVFSVEQELLATRTFSAWAVRRGNRSDPLQPDATGVEIIGLLVQCLSTRLCSSRLHVSIAVIVLTASTRI